MDRIITYAQNREDIILDAFFDSDEIGFYVDVGAEAPTDLSVTKIFYDRGWHGINIEPIKRQYELFVADRPKDINLNIGISDKSGKLTLREYEGSGYSTFSDDMKAEHATDDESLAKQYQDYEVPITTLKEIFREHEVTAIQFLKVDVEGLEYEVLAGNDWKQYRPEVICIEANHVHEDWRSLLKKERYTQVFFDGLNEYYTDDSTVRAKKFNYVKSVIFKEPIVHYELLKDFTEYDKNIAWLEGGKAEVDDANAKLTAELELAQSQVQGLQSALNEVTPLRRHVVKSAKRRLNKVDQKMLTKLSNDGQFTPEASAPAHEQLSPLDAAQTYDKRNFATYNAARKSHPLLPVYVRTRTVAHRTARKVMSKVFKG
jgi:FkbM family methyltransferase